MELNKITDRVWYYPFEKERDRPILGYVKGDDWSLAVDAGHSKEHTLEFYAALKKSKTAVTLCYCSDSLALGSFFGAECSQRKKLLK